MHTPAAVLAMVTSTLIAAASPPVFSTKSFEDAKAQSIKEHKLLIVDSMADWCGPCKMMDKTTWVDDTVVRWIGDNAIALQFDVDKDKDLAKQFNIRAMPTLIVLKDGAEFDRSEGYQSPAELIKWLEATQQGKKAGDLQAARREALHKAAYEPVNDANSRTHANIQARLDWTRQLASDNKDDEATEEFVWLWENMNKEDPNFVGVRSSFMASDMERLAAQHPPAKKRFTALRDALEVKLKAGESTSNELSDWMVLNKVVNDDARTIAWYNRVKDDPQARPDIERARYHLHQIFERRKNWAGLASLSADPVAEARANILTSQMAMRMVLKDDPKRIRDVNLDSLLSDIKHLYIGLLALGREDDADKVAAVLTEAIDQPLPRRALVAAALDADQPRERQLKLLDEADARDTASASRHETAALRSRLKNAIEKARK